MSNQVQRHDVAVQRGRQPDCTHTHTQACLTSCPSSSCCRPLAAAWTAPLLHWPLPPPPLLPPAAPSAPPAYGWPAPGAAAPAPLS